MITRKRVYQVIKDFSANINYRNQIVNYTYKKGRNVKFLELDSETIYLIKNNFIKEFEF